jgi:hypothetical protein
MRSTYIAVVPAPVRLHRPAYAHSRWVLGECFRCQIRDLCAYALFLLAGQCPLERSKRIPVKKLLN